MKCKICKEPLVNILGRGFVHQDGKLEKPVECTCQDPEHMLKSPNLHKSHYVQPVP